MARADEVCKIIEAAMAREVGRGSECMATHTSGMLLEAARSLLGRRCRVAIVTGFFIPSATPPGAETDGPVGAVQLAAALTILGIPVELVTDHPCAAIVESAVEASGFVIPVAVAPLDAWNGVKSEYARWEESVLQGFNDLARPVTHLVAIERPGPNHSGLSRNMKGEDISAYTAPLHRIFQRRGWLRIGIGDGGNELGMGLLPSQVVASAVLHGADIQCTVKCDYLLVGGTSNWAAAGLVAALVELSPIDKCTLIELLGADWSHRIIEFIVANAGAVDGVLKVPAVSVDGLCWEEYSEVLEEIRAIVSQ